MQIWVGLDFQSFLGNKVLSRQQLLLLTFELIYEICIPLLPYFSIFEDIWKQYKFTLWEWVRRFVPSAPQ